MGTQSASIERDPGRLRALADSLDCLTEEDFCLLADISPTTCDNWRRRGTGPSYILIGNRYLYPRKAVATHLHGLIRQRNAAARLGAYR